MNLTGSGARPGGVPPYRFDDIVVDPAAHSLSRGGESQSVEPKTFAVLLALLQRPGELVSRDDLLDLAWGHRHVTPGVLTRAIAQLRHALADDAQQPRYIQTRHALGYSFIGCLQAPPEADPAPPVEALAGTDGTSEEGATAGQPELPAGPVGAGRVDRRKRADSMSTWDPAEPAPMTVRITSWHRKAGAWLLLAVLLAALVAWVVGQRVAAPPRAVAASVAVMPFTSLSGHPGDEYFAEGLAEEMRDALAGVKGLNVAAPVSSDAGNGAADAKALGARFGVATILEASVRREGPRIRITARLSDTATGFTLWSHTYDRELSGVFATQSEIANEVVHALLGAMPGESEALTKRLTPTHNEAAFDIYLKGLQLLHHASSAGALDQAVEHFDQALKQDSGFARAQAGLCRAEILRFQNSHSTEAFANAQLACQRAARMDPTLAEVNVALGDLYAASGDRGRALEHYRASLRQAVTPRWPIAAHVGMAHLYAAEGKRDLSVQEFRQALELSPDNALVYGHIGYQQYLDGQLQQAVASLRRAVELAPDNADLWDTLGGVYMAVGDNRNAAAALQRATGIRPTAITLSNLGLIRFQAGDYAAAVNLQRQAIALDPQDYTNWGSLGDALRAIPADAAEARKAYGEAANRAEGYLQAKPDDAEAVAALGLYRVVLGDAASARKLVERAESLPDGQSREVALFNAETLALLGELEPARQRLARARAKGVPDTEINGNLTFRRLGLLPPSGATGKPASAESPVPSQDKGHPTGG